MKIINDLIICEIPKDARDISIEYSANKVFVDYDVNNVIGQTPLPSGYEYEVIGTETEARYSMTNDIMYRVIKAGGYEWHVGFLTTVFNELKQDAGIVTNDTTDLLFIKRVKK